MEEGGLGHNDLEGGDGKLDGIVHGTNSHREDMR